MKSQGNRKSISYACTSLIIHVSIALLNVNSGRNRTSQLSLSARQVSSETCKSLHKDKLRVIYLKIPTAATLPMISHRDDRLWSPASADLLENECVFISDPTNTSSNSTSPTSTIFRCMRSTRWGVCKLLSKRIHSKFEEIRWSKSIYSRIAFKANSVVWKRKQIK